MKKVLCLADWYCSSGILDSLVSEYQRSLLDLIYYGDRTTRDKIVILFSEMIDPKLNADMYLDSEDIESELKQVLLYIEKKKHGNLQKRFGSN